MTEALLHSGDVIEVVVTSAKPFGLLVQARSGLHGLVRGGRAAVGATLRVRVVEFDAAESRFSATIAG